ncbi:MAG: hypothetical protein HOP33_12970 [Verrucomicrobia bacterium]|nr:hypothetical protein [Verrucomicrobiota bacterium]
MCKVVSGKLNKQVADDLGTVSARSKPTGAGGGKMLVTSLARLVRVAEHPGWQ